MTKFITVALLAASFAVAVSADAHAWGRSWAVTGPRGTGTMNRSGSCAGGSCSWQNNAAGPNGRSWNGSGSGSCAGGTCSYSGSGTGWRGNPYSYTGSVSR
jgi:hypothetical protein